MLSEAKHLKCLFIKEILRSAQGDGQTIMAL